MAAAKRLSRGNPQATRQGREGASRSRRRGHKHFFQELGDECGSLPADGSHGLPKASASATTACARPSNAPAAD
jgi:hypothetical protein